MPACLIALGSNLGPREHTLERAVAALGRGPSVRVVAVSRWRATRPVGGPAGQPPFLNGAVLIETALDPQSLLEALASIERELGRTREERWGPRTIDLDLLLYGDRVVESPGLMVPHPSMAWRRFVLEPAAEIAPQMLHPTTGWTIARLLEHLDTSLPYVAVAGPIGVGKSHLARRLAQGEGADLMAEEVDSSRLAEFYANPSGTAWPMELEFLHQRGRRLAADHARWSAGRLVVSDFWFDQSLAFAGVWLPEERREAFRREWERVGLGVARPKLLVLLDAPLEELRERIRRRGRPCEQGLSPDVLERIRRAILDLAGRPGVGPVLRLAYDDPQAALVEVLAAIEAMRS